jgi:hypothetical protein
MEEILKVTFRDVLWVRFGEWQKKVVLSFWKREWNGMTEIQRGRYNFFL